MRNFFWVLWFCGMSTSTSAQIQPDLLQAVAAHYYKNERPVRAGFFHHLYLFDEVNTLPRVIAESLVEHHPTRKMQLKAARTGQGTQMRWSDVLEKYPAGLKAKLGKPYALDEFNAMLAKRTTQHPYLLVVFTPYRVSDSEYIVIVRHFRNSEHQKEEVAVWKLMDGNWHYAEQLYFFKP